MIECKTKIHVTHPRKTVRMRQIVWSLPVFLILLSFLLEGKEHSSSALEPYRRNPESMLMVGEELEYSVHYSFFHIGTIRLKILDRIVENGKVKYHAAAYIDSNPSLSWLVDLHVRFFSIFDRDVFSYYWMGEDSTPKEIRYQNMRFDYDRKKMFFESGVKKRGKVYQQKRDTVSISENCQEGLSLFYYARAYLHQKANVTIPTCISNEERRTTINFLGKRESVEIDSVPYPIDCIYFEGTADFTGIFGLTGGFEGWFSNDEAAVPITASMKVVLGSVRVELRKWTRQGWTPPRSANE